MPSGGCRLISLVLVMMLETLRPRGRQKNNGVGYFYWGAKRQVRRHGDAAWCLGMVQNSGGKHGLESEGRAGGPSAYAGATPQSGPSLLKSA